MPKRRFTADLEDELYDWVMSQKESRNEILKQAVELIKKAKEEKNEK